MVADPPTDGRPFLAPRKPRPRQYAPQNIGRFQGCTTEQLRLARLLRISYRINVYCYISNSVDAKKS